MLAVNELGCNVTLQPALLRFVIGTHCRFVKELLNSSRSVVRRPFREIAGSLKTWSLAVRHVSRCASPSRDVPTSSRLRLTSARCRRVCFNVASFRLSTRDRAVRACPPIAWPRHAPPRRAARRAASQPRHCIHCLHAQLPDAGAVTTQFACRADVPPRSSVRVVAYVQ